MEIDDKYIGFVQSARRWPKSMASYEAYSRNKPGKLPPIYWIDGRRYFLRTDVAAWEAAMIQRDNRVNDASSQERI